MGNTGVTGPTSILRYFEFDHLRAGPLRNASRPFHKLAWELEGSLPPGPEKTVALRKLLESKDAAVRAALGAAGALDAPLP